MTEIFARAGGPRNQGGDDGNLWDTIADLIDAAFQKIDKLEATVAAQSRIIAAALSSSGHSEAQIEAILGSAGRTVTSGRIDADGHLVLNFSNGETEDLGQVIFEPPAPLKALKFERGPDGRITGAALA